jgi:hypothetical protein
VFLAGNFERRQFELFDDKAQCEVGMAIVLETRVSCIDLEGPLVDVNDFVLERAELGAVVFPENVEAFFCENSLNEVVSIT